MVKKILAVLAGIIAGAFLIMIVEAISGKLFPMPQGVDMTNSVEMQTFKKIIPPMVILLLLIGYVIGAFTGGLIATLISRNIQQAVIIGVFFTIGNVMNVIEIPHPLWLAVVSTVLFFPFAYLGGKMGLGKR